MTFILLLKELALVVINLEHKLSLQATAIIGFQGFSHGCFFAVWLVIDDYGFTCGNGIAEKRIQIIKTPKQQRRGTTKQIVSEKE